MKKILFINNIPAQCGVYEFGRSIKTLLSTNEHFRYGESNSWSQTELLVNFYKPDFIIYNYHPIVTTYLNEDLARRYPSAITAHDNGNSWSSVKQVYLDPDYKENGLNFKICRPILPFSRTLPIIPNSIGAFGFGFSHKRYEDLIYKVNEEFDEATVRIHMPFSTYCDYNGYLAMNYANQCRAIKTKPGIRLDINHNYLSTSELLNWISQNSINCFLFNGTSASSGCSSSTDWAIAVKQPIAISHDIMFRHLFNVDPPIFIERGLRNLIEQGFDPIEKVTYNWNAKTLWDDFQRIAGT